MDVGAFCRRLLIRDLIISMGKISVTELAERFNVSKNTISRDISLLSGIVPITGKTGRKGGYFYTGDKILTLALPEAEGLAHALSELHSNNVYILTFIKKLTR